MKNADVLWYFTALHTPLSEWKVFGVGREKKIKTDKNWFPMKLKSNEFKLNILLSMICVLRQGPYLCVFGMIDFFLSFLFIAFGKVGLMNVSPLNISSFFSSGLFLCSAFYVAWSEWKLNAIIRFVWLNELVCVSVCTVFFSSSPIHCMHISDEPIIQFNHLITF